MRCQITTYEGKQYFMPYCWGGVIHGPSFCTCPKPKKKIKIMDVINKLHSAFKEAQHFEFGDDYVKFLDQDTGKSYMVKVEEVATANVSAHISTKKVKTIKDKPKTWADVIRAKNE